MIALTLPVAVVALRALYELFRERDIKLPRRFAKVFERRKEEIEIALQRLEEELNQNRGIFDFFKPNPHKNALDRISKRIVRCIDDLSTIADNQYLSEAIDDAQYEYISGITRDLDAASDRLSEEIEKQLAKEPREVIRTIHSDILAPISSLITIATLV